MDSPFLHRESPHDGRIARVQGHGRTSATCLVLGAFLVLPSSHVEASRPLPPLGYRLVLHAPRVIKVGQPSLFHVDVIYRPRETIGTRWGGYDVDFAVTGGWKRPHIRTSDGSQACGGDLVPRQPRREHRSVYWLLDFGDCVNGIDLVLTATTPGMHSLVIRLFAAPIVGGTVLLSKRVLEARFSVHWHGAVVP